MSNTMMALIGMSATSGAKLLQQHTEYEVQIGKSWSWQVPSTMKCSHLQRGRQLALLALLASFLRSCSVSPTIHREATDPPP
mmetsp:Transcript_95046/g.167861  ORF Transcript_95046/g.167861 Transcript_95046/m.167861 type:complete len:82 (+) Transcript_95046:676-921(+)